MVDQVSSEQSSSSEYSLKEAFNMAAISALFFLSVASYYQIKPASRTLAITVLGSSSLPYLWIGSAICLLLLLPLFSWRASRFSATNIVASTASCLVVLLVAFYFFLSEPTAFNTAAFYILSDIYGVVLIEECWGWTSSRMRKNQSKPWYGIVGSGALLGGMVGSVLATTMMKQSFIPFKTVDLLLVAALLLLVLLILLFFINKFFPPLDSIKLKPSATDQPPVEAAAPKEYLILIASLILVAQLIEPIIEYQFMSSIESNISGLDERTTFLSKFFTLLSLGGLFINLAIFPILYHIGGITAGLISQPILVLIGSLIFIKSQTLASGAILKFLDRGLSYSVNRSSKELLYLPLKSAAIYKAKSLIDMFGYRLFKVLSSLGIIAATKLFGDFSLVYLSYTVCILAIFWIILIPKLINTYNKLQKLN